MAEDELARRLAHTEYLKASAAEELRLADQYLSAWQAFDQASATSLAVMDEQRRLFVAREVTRDQVSAVVQPVEDTAEAALEDLERVDGQARAGGGSMAAFSSLSLGLLRPRKRKRGRPRKLKPHPGTILTGLRLPRVGRPQTITAETERWLLNRIDRRKAAYLTKYGVALSDAKALRLDMAAHFIRVFVQEGVPRQEALERATLIIKGPRFRSVRVRLAQARSRARTRSS